MKRTNYSLSFLLYTIILIFSTLFINQDNYGQLSSPIFANAQPYCNTPFIASKPALYQTQGETVLESLSLYIQGFNLSFSIKENQPQGFTLKQTIELAGQSQAGVSAQFSAIAQPIALSNGSVVIAALQQDASKDYYILFSTLQDGATDTPNFFSNNRRPLPLQIDNATQCFDITLLQDDLAVVDCLHAEPQNGPYSTWFFIGNMYDTFPVTFQTGNSFLQSPIQGRKSVKYSYNGIIYLFSFTPFTQYFPNQENFIEVYRYNYNNVSSDYAYGTLDFITLITGTTLGLQEDKDLQLVDVQVQGSYIYVMDHAVGIICFQFQGQQLLNKMIYQLGLKSDVLKWGFAINNIGGSNILVIATSLPFVFEYNWPEVQNDPIMQNQYETLYSSLQDIISLTINFNYVATQVGKLTSIYLRRISNTKIEQIQTSLTNYNQIQLLGPSDNLLAYNFASGQVSNYRLWTSPIIQIQDHQWQSINLIAQSTYLGNTITCVQQFNTQTIPQSGDTQIYKSGITIPLQYDMAGDYGATVPLGIQYYGPNIIYSAQIFRPSSNDDRILSETEDKLNQAKYYQPIANTPTVARIIEGGILAQDVIFTKLKNINDYQYYALHQLKNYTVQIYFCQSTQTTWLQVQCGQSYLAQIIMTGPIQTFADYQWNQQPNWMAVTSADLSTVYSYNYLGQPTFNKTFQDSIITDLSLGNNLIYAIIERDGITGVDVYIYDQTLVPYCFINQVTIKNYPNAQNFNPIKLIVPHYEHPGLLFIQSQTYVTILALTDSGTIFMSNIIPTMPQGNTNWAVVVSQYSLLMLFDGPDGQVQEYSIIDITNPQFVKIFQLYDNTWSVFTPLAYTFSGGSQLLYLAVNQSQSQGQMQTAIFVYKTGLVPEIQSLYTVFTLPTNATISSANMSVCGQQFDNLYVRFNETNFKMYRIPKYPNLYIPPQMPDNNALYLEKLQLEIQVMPWNDPTGEISLTYNLTTINSGTAVFFNQNVIVNQDLNELLEVPYDATNFPYNITFLDRQWFSGQILGYNVSCPNCSDVFQFFNHLEKTSLKFPTITESPVDIYMDPQSHYIYVLTKYTLQVLYPDNLTQVYPQVTLGINFPDYCTQLVPQHFTNSTTAILTNMYILCYVNELNIFSSLRVQFNQNSITVAPTVMEQINLPDIQKPGDAVFLDGLLIVLNLGQPKGMLPGTNGAIYAYQLNSTSQEAQLVQAYDSNSLQYQFANLTSFDLWIQDSNTRKLVISNNNTFIFFLTFPSNDYTSFQSTMQQFNLQGFLQQKNLALPTMSTIKKVYILFCGSNINNSLSYQVIVFTDVVAHYEIEFLINSNNQIDSGMSKIPRIYAAYGYNQAMSRVQLFYQNRLIPGQNIVFIFVVNYYDIGNNQLTLALYDRFKNPDIPASPTQPNVITMLGGMTFDQVYYPNQFAVNFQINKQSLLQPSIICSNESLNSMSFINYNFLLQFQVNSVKFNNQSITFSAMSDFVQDLNSNFTIPISKIEPYVPPTPSSSTSSSGSDYPGDNNWWIALLIIGCMIIGGAALVIIFRKKKLITKDEEKDVAVSLQNNLNMIQ